MADQGPQKYDRKPVGNFFIKKSLQMGLIFKIIAAALISSIVSSGALLLVYYVRYKEIAVYIWNQTNNDLLKDHVIWLILPTLIISTTVGLIVAFGIGLYASRKFAVPVYKIEQWAGLLLSGKMAAILKFREQEEMRDLSQKCNELGSLILETMTDIQKNVNKLQAAGLINPELNAIAEKLKNFELANTIEIHSPVVGK